MSKTSDPTAGMFHPAICRHCGHLHDAGSVEVVARYSDCSVWRCPRCEVQIDDRPYAFGGSLTGQAAREGGTRSMLGWDFR